MGVSRTAYIVNAGYELERINVSTFKELRGDTFHAAVPELAGRTLHIVYVKTVVFNDVPMMPIKVEFWRFKLDEEGRLDKSEALTLAAAQKRLYRAELAYRAEEFFSDPLFVVQCDPARAKAASEQAETEIASILQWKPDPDVLCFLREEGVIAVKEEPAVNTWLQYAIETAGLDQDEDFAQAALFFREGEEDHSLVNLPEDLPVRLGVGTRDAESPCGDRTIYYNRNADKALQILWAAYEVKIGARLAGALKRHDLEPCYPSVSVGFLCWLGLPVDKAPFCVRFKDLVKS